MNTERKVFEDALLADKYDHDTRKVFADWLEEHGEDDESQVHRAWTPEWQQAEDWLLGFCKDVSEGEQPIPLDSLLQVVKDYVETGEQSIVGGSLGFGATNHFDDAVRDEFWRQYETYTRSRVDSEKKEDESGPFACCY